MNGSKTIFRFRLILCLAIPAVALAADGAASDGRQVTRQVGADSAIHYLLDCQKPNGAFGPLEHDYSDLAWNYPAVHALTLLGAEIPRAEDCLAVGQWAGFREKDAHRVNLHWDLYQKVQLQRLLVPRVNGAEMAVFPNQRDDGTTIDLGGRWSLRYVDREGKYYGPYRLCVFYDVTSLWYMVSALTALDGTIVNTELANRFIADRQASNGGFVDAYRTDARPSPVDTHLVITCHAVMALKALGLDVPNRDACVAWIRSCQAPSGGFRWSPVRDDPSNQADVWYTWEAARALHALDAEPADLSGCLGWLNSLQNVDGGFGDRPGWNSRIYSTYYAVHSLDLLTDNAVEAISSKTARQLTETIPDGKYRVFQAHLKTPAVAEDSPQKMVEAVRDMRLDLVGVKTGDVTAAREYVDEKGYDLEVVACPENYPHCTQWIGGNPADHISNWLIPPSMTSDQEAIFRKADDAGKAGLPWPEFKHQVIRPMQEMGTLFYPELDYSMVNAYMIYDDGLAGGHGHNAFIAALGWPCWDWVRQVPYRERWVGKLPALADGDAHGDIAKWRDRLEKQRILYIAEGFHLPQFLDALQAGHSVCVLRDDRVEGGVVYYGGPAAVEYVKRHRSEWQWW